MQSCEHGFEAQTLAAEGQTTDALNLLKSVITLSGHLKSGKFSLGRAMPPIRNFR
jgi:hypothetical protein